MPLVEQRACPRTDRALVGAVTCTRVVGCGRGVRVQLREGQLKAPMITKGTIADKDMRACVVKALEPMTFPAPETAPTKAQLRLSFRPPE